MTYRPPSKKEKEQYWKNLKTQNHFHHNIVININRTSGSIWVPNLFTYLQSTTNVRYYTTTPSNSSPSIMYGHCHL